MPLALEVVQDPVEEGPCRMLLFVTWEGTALISQLHGSDKSLFFQKKKFLDAFFLKEIAQGVNRGQPPSPPPFLPSL